MNSQNRTAVLITGNPYYVGPGGKQKALADDFYGMVESILREAGYEVNRDPGEPHTSPPYADLWVGHSRGSGRLRFAPKSTKTVRLDDYESAPTIFLDRVRAAADIVRHRKRLKDIPVEERAMPSVGHYRVTPRMRRALQSA